MEYDMSLNIKRRKIVKAIGATLLASSASFLFFNRDDVKKLKKINVKNQEHVISSIPNMGYEHESAVRDNLQKGENFNPMYSEDIFLTDEKYIVFNSTLRKILRVQKVIGYANFNLISFDEMILYARRFPQIGVFTKNELSLIDEMFFYDASQYGFYGSKVIKELTAKINKKETIKIPGSGHYLFHGDALTKFKQLERDVGPELILTSGVRSVVKQLQLFLAKLDSSKGNLSLASRSLAPPGHSYHGIGDFDVGKKGFGKLNFTSQFSNTKEYKKLIELKYIDLRYTQGNKLGVRYEPWHIKVV